MIKKLLIAMLLSFASPLMAVTISTTTSLDGPTDALLLQAKESLTYTLSGTFTGTARLEKSFDATNWEPVGISSTNNSGATLTGVLESRKKPTLFRWFGSTITAGSFVFTISDNDDLSDEILNNKKVPIIQFRDDSVNVLGNLTTTGGVTASGGLGDASLGDATADTITASQDISTPFLIFSSTFSIAATTPTVVGQMALDSNFDVYVASGNQNPTQWIKVSSQ